MYWAGLHAGLDFGLGEKLGLLGWGSECCWARRWNGLRDDHWPRNGLG
jgi:hypothetical protein